MEFYGCPEPVRMVWKPRWPLRGRASEEHRPVAYEMQCVIVISQKPLGAYSVDTTTQASKS